MSYQAKINTISRVFYISGLSLLLTIITPFIAYSNELPFKQAEMVTQMSQSNPYQALVYILTVITGLSILAMGYLYNPNMHAVKEQFVILKDVSQNLNKLSDKIENSNKTIEKSLDVVNTKLNDKPCLLDSDLLKDLLKRK
jgi:hypothetical protein